MKKLISAAGILFLMAMIVSAQRRGAEPSFSAYRVRVEQRAAKAPNLASHKNARTYRTNLRNAAKEGINFAGHYVFTYWGCGTNCMVGALIDARTGKVFFPNALQGVGSGMCDVPEESETFEYKPDSRLLVLSGFKGGAQNDQSANCGIYYLEWTGTNFRQVKFVPKKSSI